MAHSSKTYMKGYMRDYRAQQKDIEPHVNRVLTLLEGGSELDVDDDSIRTRVSRMHEELLNKYTTEIFNSLVLERTPFLVEMGQEVMEKVTLAEGFSSLSKEEKEARLQQTKEFFSKSLSEILEDWRKGTRVKVEEWLIKIEGPLIAELKQKTFTDKIREIDHKNGIV